MNDLILPTSYLPPISYMAMLTSRSTATIEIYESYPKQTHRNRCEILTSNGVMRLSVPVVRVNGNHTITANVEISYAEKWNIQHIRAIESAYNNAPYFLYLWDGLKAILVKRHKRLIDFNQLVIEYLLAKMSIPCRLNYSKDYVDNYGHSLTDSGLDMRGMFDHRRMKQSEYCTNRQVPYYQVWRDRFGFCPELSVIDLLFNLGPDESRNYLRQMTDMQ